MESSNRILFVFSFLKSEHRLSLTRLISKTPLSIIYSVAFIRSRPLQLHGDDIALTTHAHALGDLQQSAGLLWLRSDQYCNDVNMELTLSMEQSASWEAGSPSDYQ
jgi:hypothetical protein